MRHLPFYFGEQLRQARGMSTCGETEARWVPAGSRAGTVSVVLLALVMSACGGGAAQAPTRAAEPPEAPAAEEWRPSPPTMEWGTSPPAATEAEPTEASAVTETTGGRSFDDHDRALLCGPGPVGTGASGFDDTQKEVQEGDRAVVDRVRAARATSEKDCRTAVDALNGVFQQLAASSRTLCDHQFARGIGVTGDELVARTSAVLTEVEDRVASIASGGNEACPAQASRLAASVERWRRQRDRICAPTAEQKAIATCGVEASDAAQQQRAKSYCDALAAKGVANPVLSRPIEQCVSAALNARR
jgi:hypothetical protein